MKKSFSRNPLEMVPFEWKLLALLKPISVTTRAALAISCQFCSNYLLSSTVVQLVFSNEHKLKIVSDCNYIHHTLIYKSSNSMGQFPHLFEPALSFVSTCIFVYIKNCLVLTISDGKNTSNLN